MYLVLKKRSYSCVCNWVFHCSIADPSHIQLPLLQAASSLRYMRNVLGNHKQTNHFPPSYRSVLNQDPCSITLKNSCYKLGIFCLTKHLHCWNRAGIPFTFGNFKSYLTGSLLAIIANRREWDRCKNISIPQLRL